jgi:hypothetical protein
MGYNVVVKLYSEYRHHGSHGPKTHAVRSAVASKARAILSKKTPSESTSTNGEASIETKDRVAVQSKAYGTHGGNVHVMTLYSEKDLTPDKADLFLKYIDNATSKFEAMTSFDVKFAKNKYASHKAEILNRYNQQYGEDLSESTATAALKELAEHSFDYTQHQIVVLIESDESFEGARPTKEGRFVRELRSKRNYTKGRTLLSQEQRDALKKVSKTEIQLTRSASLGKGARIIVNLKTGRKELQIDFGQLAGRVYEVDTY